MLAAMQPAMDTAQAIGAPVTRADAAGILATGAPYLEGAARTVGALDKAITRREAEVEQLRLTDPEAAAAKAGKLDLMQQLRDRIQLSIERVSEILFDDDKDAVREAQLQELAERRRQMQLSLATSMFAPGDPSVVAGVYAAGTIHGNSTSNVRAGAAGTSNFAGGGGAR